MYDFHLFYVQLYEKHNAFKLETVFLSDEELNDNFFDNDDLQLSDVDDVKVNVAVAVKSEFNFDASSSDQSSKRSTNDQAEQVPYRRKIVDFPVIRVKKLKFDDYLYIKSEKEVKVRRIRKRGVGPLRRTGGPIGRPKKSEFSRSEIMAKRRQAIEDENKHVRDYFKMTCELCPMLTTWFATFDEANQHYKNVHKLRKGYLMCCERKFKSRSLVVEHTQRHLVPEEFTCKHFGKLYWRRYDLQRHIEETHPPEEEKIFKCGKCTKSFVKEKLLKRHEVFHDEKKFMCRTCGRG